jgi:hypothetical protein
LNSVEETFFSFLLCVISIYNARASGKIEEMDMSTLFFVSPGSRPPADRPIPPPPAFYHDRIPLHSKAAY